MGMNIHIAAGDKNLPLSYPESLTDCATIPRYVDSYAFMRLVYADCDSISTCGCPDEDDHCYGCMRDSIHRPRNFEKLRQDTKEMQPWVQTLIDYLEAEPNAWLEYD